MLSGNKENDDNNAKTTSADMLWDEGNHGAGAKCLGHEEIDGS